MAEVIRRGQQPAWQTPISDRDEHRLEEASTGELVSGLMEQGRRLIREEVRLAKAEIRRETKHVGRDAGMVGGGGVLAHTGFLVLAGGIVALLALVLPVWAAALITAVAFLAIGGFMAKGGINKLKRIHGPRETVQTLKEDQQWAKQTARDAKSKMHAAT